VTYLKRRCPRVGSYSCSNAPQPHIHKHTNVTNRTATLPPPDSGLQLKHVAIGQGTQNYTCADSTAASKPLPIGAVATLYNATCAAADAPKLLAALPELALNVALPANIPSSGKHLFLGSSPFFDIYKPDLGSTTCKKIAACDAPAGAPKGKGGKGFGSVPWLKLGQVEGDPALQNIFRLNTAGGSPPPDCSGQPPNIQVPYSAEYVFFVTSPPSSNPEDWIFANSSYRYWIWGV
jgi:hypothetical protein